MADDMSVSPFPVKPDTTKLRDKVLADISEQLIQQFSYTWWEAEETGLTESPIETAFLVALEGMGRVGYVDVLISEKDDSEEYYSRTGNLDGDHLIYVIPQAKIGDYRVDFLIRFGSYAAVESLIVECDGHDFHDRTPFQASRDRKRDRDLVSAGYKVFRFTGSDINRRATECADEVLMFARIRLNAMRRQLRASG